MSDRPNSRATRFPSRFTRLQAWLLLLTALLLALNLALRTHFQSNRVQIERLRARVAATEQLRDAELRAVHDLALDPVLLRCLALEPPGSVGLAAVQEPIVRAARGT